MSVFCVGLPGKARLPRREPDGMPLRPQHPQQQCHSWVLRFTLLPLPRVCPGRRRGCATSRAAALPVQPTHTHTGGKRAGVPRGPLPGTVTPSPPSLCALAAEESGSRGHFGRWLGWLSCGAMCLFRGGPSVSVFCVGLPEKGTRQCRERGETPPTPATPQTTTTSLRPFPSSPCVPWALKRVRNMPRRCLPRTPRAHARRGKSLSELLGTRHPALPARFSQISPFLKSTVLLTHDSVPPPPHPFSSHAT